MEITGCVALVTGANRGLGKAYVEALLAAGAAKVYAGAREPSRVAVSDPRVVPVALDVTSASAIAAAVGACPDVTLLINNAGVLRGNSLLAPEGEAALRAEMEVNVFGMAAMIRAFAPVIEANGGGAIANMLSVVAWFVSALNPTYSISKHAALGVSDAARMELRARGIHVVGVYAGFIETEMVANVPAPKVSPRQVAEATLRGVRAGQDHVLADERAARVWTASRTDPAGLAAEMAAAWDRLHPRAG
jgi:NAD(P)-dependent dehydrogenase (short-subunit alcohol dehydrogenase family)